jgi:hypothetical protein
VWVERALHFLHAGGDTAPDATRRRSPDTVLSAALALSREEPPHRRWELEARLLTDEPFDVIARKCSLRVETVASYEVLHFDVRRHLQCADWIAVRVIGPGLWRGFNEGELGQVWKLFAYRGGAAALDLVLAVTQGRPLPAWARGRPGDAYGEARLHLLSRLLLGALRARSDEEVSGLVATYEEAVTLDQRMSPLRPRLTADLRAPRALLDLAASGGPGGPGRQGALQGAAQKKTCARKQRAGARHVPALRL